MHFAATRDCVRGNVGFIEEADAFASERMVEQDLHGRCSPSSEE